MIKFEEWHMEHSEDSDYIYVGPYNHLDMVDPIVSLHDERAAHLIAAAPVLLGALWVMVEHNALHFGEDHNTVIAGRAAIKQAKGQ